MSLQEEGISNETTSRWLFEAYPTVVPTLVWGKKQKRGVGEAATTSAPAHLQSPTLGEARADMVHSKHISF
ncbi:hypothetical protein E2562_037585 [Oryza meyeriana var. granulata]|uniref:Uncharacterized protein n=1 Tax=Oryza meyeriana var. granulata TaxID=110450 RepID=A0A6G1ETY4_9ORYZ|nr:hypothetical protein E2562_037585 [Oryza meyeriana var. granulata]